MSQPTTRTVSTDTRGDDTLPMPHPSHSRTTAPEREEYRIRFANFCSKHPNYPALLHRPSPEIVNRILTLLGSSLPAGIPNSNNPRAAFVLLLDLFFRAAEDGNTVSYNDAFDTLCRKYSDHYVLCNATRFNPRANKSTRPAGRLFVRDMRPQTALACRRDLLLNDIKINDLWKTIVKWTEADANPLCSIRRFRTDTANGKAEYIIAKPKVSPQCAQFRNLVNEEPAVFRNRSGLPLDIIKSPISSAPTQAIYPIGAKFCAEVPYNVVVLGKRSNEILSLQASARLIFDSDAFKRDYLLIQQATDGTQKELTTTFLIDIDLPDKPRSIRIKRKGKENQKTEKGGKKVAIWSQRDEFVFYRSIEMALTGQIPASELPHEHLFVTAKIQSDPGKWQSRYRNFDRWLQRNGTGRLQVSSIDLQKFVWAAVHTWNWRLQVRSILAEYDRKRRHLRLFRLVHRQVEKERGLLTIASTFERSSNRRYQPKNMWPLYATDEADSQPEDPAVRSEDDTYRRRWFRARDPIAGRHCKLVGYDISSSQTQIVATLLGAEALEAVAMNPNESFKAYMAKMAFDLDQKYRPLCKCKSRNKCDQDCFQLRHVALESNHIPKNYSGPDDRRLQNLCKQLWMEVSYGSNPFMVATRQEKDPKTFGPGWTWKDADFFLQLLNHKFPEMREFLDMCRYIAAHANLLDGIRITDPLDGSKVRWHPVARTNRQQSNGGCKLILSLPNSTDLDDEFSLDAQYPISSVELQRMFAPCLVHMLDAYFSSLVMERLAKRGVEDFVGMHDCWLVPERLRDRGSPRDGHSVLAEVISEAASEWFNGLSPVYADLARLVGNNKEYKDFVDAAHARWRTRVRQGYVPKFAFKPH